MMMAMWWTFKKNDKKTSTTPTATIPSTLNADADKRSPGAAVPLLCGHWEHDGSCRWLNIHLFLKLKMAYIDCG